MSFALAAGEIEIVQSVPLETTLKISGIRDPKTVWLEMIRKAKTSIDLEHFYITDGKPLTEIMAELRKVSTQVRVRFIVDNNFYEKYPEGPDSLATTSTIEVRSLDMAPGIQHGKFMIIDGKESFIGSQNFDWRALIHIHEVGARITNSQASQKVQKVFDRDWAQAEPIRKNKAVETAPTLTVGSSKKSLTIVASPESKNPPGVGASLAAILNLLQSATKTADLEVMDYSPTLDNGKWTKLDDAIRAAAEKRVNVRMLIDDKHYLRAKAAIDALAKLSNISIKSVIIPVHSSGEIPYARLIHAKFLITDNANAWLGTENWVGGYFENSRNIGLVTSDVTATKSLSAIYSKVWESAYATAVPK